MFFFPGPRVSYCFYRELLSLQNLKGKAKPNTHRDTECFFFVFFSWRGHIVENAYFQKLYDCIFAIFFSKIFVIEFSLNLISFARVPPWNFKWIEWILERSSLENVEGKARPNGHRDSQCFFRFFFSKLKNWSKCILFHKYSIV